MTDTTTATYDAVQILVCGVCGKTWEREAQVGRPPRYCDECRRKPIPRPTKAAEGTKVTPVGGGHHVQFKTLLAVAKARVPAMLVGPAGSGKSTAGRQVASTLGLHFTSESCSPQMTKWDIMGFVGPNGNYVAGCIRNAFENGGVLLLDEIDASNPAVLVSVNLIASVRVGETVTFPDGQDVARHPDFILIAGGNTYGDGASEEYVGREQLDAATLDRFAMVDWPYDERLERVAAGDADEWVSYVQRVRAAVLKVEAPMLITPRASINGAMLLDSGMTRKTVEDLVIWKGASADVKRSVKAELAKGV